MADAPLPSGWLPPRPPGPEPPSRPRGDRRDGGRPARRPPAAPLATAALVLGITGIALLVLSLGLAAPLALMCSTTAWTCAVVERRRSRALDPDRPAPARAGLILGAVGVVAGILAVVLWALLLAGGTTAGEVLEQWRQELEREQRQRAIEI